MGEYCYTYISNEVKIDLEMVFNDWHNLLFMIEQLDTIKKPNKNTQMLIISLRKTLSKYMSRNNLK